MRPPPDLTQLGDIVGELGTDRADVVRATLVEAFDAIAFALDGFDPASHEALAIHALAKKIGVPSAPADHVKEALALVMRRLGTLAPPAARREAYQHVVATASAATDRLHADKPLAGQMADVREAFRAATDALRLAANEPIWFGTGAGPGPVMSFPVARDAAEKALLAFSSTSWADARPPGGHAIAALADLIDATRACHPTPPVGAQTTEMRFQAGVVRRAEYPSLGRGQQFKLALTAATDALTATTHDTPGASYWIGNATSAIANLPDQASLGFSRGPIQGALRATFDAVVATCDPTNPSRGAP